MQELINFGAEKELFYSHAENKNFRLFKSNDNLIYVFLHPLDLNVYVTSKLESLSISDAEFLIEKYKNFDFVLTNCSCKSSKKLLKVVEVDILHVKQYFDRVLVK